MTAMLAALVLAASYDPLAVAEGAPASIELSAGEVPLRVYLPTGTEPAPVILFSHGLGGSRDGNRFLGEHWARRGYVAVFLQHPGSDSAVWKDVPQAERLAAMKSAASLENFLARTGHVVAVLDALAQWNDQPKHPLKGRLDLSKVGMSGHSFGAVTTQALSGQLFPLGKRFTDARIKAALVLSPSVPRRGDPEHAFGTVKVPWMLMTGTHDQAVIGDQTAASRLGVFPALPNGRKYELVLKDAEHSAFTDRALPGDSLPRNPNHHRLLLAFSTAFFDSTLKGDAAARAWLEGADAKALLEKGDRWQRK
jgi:predicted dienelactone hydrolase